MVEYWFCMSAQSAQKKWEACKQVREGQPYKATPVTAFKSRERHSHRGCLAELHTVHCGETQRPDHWIVVLGDSLVKGKKSQFYPDPASRQAEQGSTDFKVLQVASFHPRLKEPESHDSQSLPQNYNTITFLGMGVHP